MKKEYAEVELRVRYSETDQMGVVHHAAYFPWLELGRMEILRKRGKSYREIEEEGVFFPIVIANCEYFEPARFDDIILVRTWIQEIAGVKIRFENEVYRKKDRKLLARGFTIHVTTNRDGKPIRAGWLLENI